MIESKYIVPKDKYFRELCEELIKEILMEEYAKNACREDDEEETVNEVFPNLHQQLN